MNSNERFSIFGVHSAVARVLMRVRAPKQRKLRWSCVQDLFNRWRAKRPVNCFFSGCMDGKQITNRGFELVNSTGRSRRPVMVRKVEDHGAGAIYYCRAVEYSQDGAVITASLPNFELYRSRKPAATDQAAAVRAISLGD
jgi:hypothetical protein